MRTIEDLEVDGYVVLKNKHDFKIWNKHLRFTDKPTHYPCIADISIDGDEFENPTYIYIEDVKSMYAALLT